MDIEILRTEITDDPLTRGYAGMTDLQVADSLNVVNRTKNRTSLSGSEILNAVNITEWNALTADEKRTVWDVVHLSGTINPFGIEATLLISVFGAGSDTIVALAALRQEAVSRSGELGQSSVFEGHVQEARM